MNSSTRRAARALFPSFVNHVCWLNGRPARILVVGDSIIIRDINGVIGYFSEDQIVNVMRFGRGRFVAA